MDNDLDTLRSKWKSAQTSARRSAKEESALLDAVRSKRSKTLNQKIERSYYVPMIVGLLLPAFAVTLLDVFDPSNLLRFVYGAFGLIMSVGCLVMIRGLRACDYSQMTVRQAVNSTRRLFHYHLILLLIGWLLCVPVLALLFKEIYLLGDVYMLWGAIIGLIAGLSIGIPREVRIYRHFKSLRHLFED